MVWPFIAQAATSVIGGLASHNASGRNIDATQAAAGVQVDAANESIDLRQTGMEDIMSLLEPYTSGGAAAQEAEQALLGLSGNDAQAQAIEQLQQGPQFGAMVQQGEEAILQNAAATGGLRGGNVQGALAQFRPQVLSNLIEQQLSNFGDVSQRGLQASGTQAQAGLQTTTGIAGDILQRGRAEAGGLLGVAEAKGARDVGVASSLSQFAGGFL